MNLFGFEIKRKDKDDQLPSFVAKENNEGAVTVASSTSTGGGYSTYVDLDGSIRTEADLVTKYREMSLQPECDMAIDEIVNESITIDEDDIVDIDLDEVKGISDSVKKTIEDEFTECLSILDFNKHAYDIFRKWYTDGRIYYNIVIDPKDVKAGIKEVRYVDPRKIRKVREVVPQKITSGATSSGEATIPKTVNEYFLFNDKGFTPMNKAQAGNNSAASGLKIAKDSIIHIVSGLTDNNGTLVLSYLHKAIKPLNQLRTLEDALVIYRLARAPERRIWYIDVGNLPKMKAEQYIRDIMVKHKNRLVYDASSGEVRDDRKFLTMLEDYWLPRREGGRGTEVDTLPGGQTLGQMDDVLYFQKKFLNTLNVPISRLNSDALFSVGRATEITRDELKFTRFVIRLRAKFSELFTKMLEKQVVLKGIMTIDEWNKIYPKIKYNYAKDNYFNELKDNEITEARYNLARNLQDMTEKYVSHEWVRKTILKQSDDDIREQDKLINEEVKSGELRWVNQTLQQAQMAMDQAEMQQQQMAAQSQQMQQGQDPNADPNATPQDGGDPNDPNNLPEQIRKAEVFIKQMKAKGNPANRSIQDQSKYKQAVQIVAKNKHKLEALKQQDVEAQTQQQNAFKQGTKGVNNG